MERPKVPTIRRTAAAPDPTGHARLRRSPIALAVIALSLTFVSAIAPAAVHAAPSAPAPEAAPADPTTSTSTPPTTVPGVDPSTTAAPTPAAPVPVTPVTAVVLADVATGAPPLVPQLASQGAAAAGGPASLVRPAPAQLPATGGVDRGVGLVAITFAGIGAALIGIGRRRRPV